MWLALDTLEKIKKVVDRQEKSPLQVSFYHSADRSLLVTHWSDRINGTHHLDLVKYKYTYEVTSKGIHFVGFEERKEGESWWSAGRYWYAT
jgi:hypothetical protein